jgi:hypothetical protein
MPYFKDHLSKNHYLPVIDMYVHVNLLCSHTKLLSELTARGMSKARSSKT